MPIPVPAFRYRRRTGVACLLLAGVSGCVAPKQVQAPPPAPVPVVAPPPPAASTDWRDIPLTPGDWRYVPTAGGSSALFGRAGSPPDFAARCDMASRTVSLSRTATAAAPATMAITTSAGNRALAATPGAGALAATLAARDPFLDKMAFSRGRFIVAVTGTARLVIPSWPEFARVIEDCRG